jgi:hypothetical protein
LVFNPEQINAFTKAHAPGIGIIFILFSIAFLQFLLPDLISRGVPASVTNAIFSPNFNLSINKSVFYFFIMSMVTN